MVEDTVSFLWKDPGAAGRFRTAVCLHGHTLHSEECLAFLPRYLDAVPGISQIARRYQSGSRPAVDFARAYWTPPLTPASALSLEREQVAGLGLQPVVSLTDHDNVEAGLSLQATASPDEAPVSVEWTVPYERSIFHLGIHNLPPASARQWMAALSVFTATPRKDRLPEILNECARVPGALIVLNHPFWLEEGMNEEDHPPALQRLLRECCGWLHAFELNGTRPWRENAAVLDLARDWRRPVISGGDRHACEPAACLNLTNARTFAEFAGEIREGRSSVVFLPQYREPLAMRILQAGWDILRPYPEYPGREHWTDRLFYRGEDGAAQPLSALWEDEVPWMLRPVTGLIQLLAATRLRPALRALLARQAEAIP